MEVDARMLRTHCCAVMDWLFLSTLTAAIGCGLIAGVFYAFSTFVMRGLGRTQPAASGLHAMQAINVTVLTPLFLVPFIGLAPLCLGLGIVAVMNWTEPNAAFLLAGSVLYLVGTFVQTRIIHVPMNDALADSDAETEAGRALWERYLSRWTTWNHVRTIASLLAAIAFTLALAT